MHATSKPAHPATLRFSTGDLPTPRSTASPYAWRSSQPVSPIAHADGGEKPRVTLRPGSRSRVVVSFASSDGLTTGTYRTVSVGVLPGFQAANEASETLRLSHVRPSSIASLVPI